LTTALTMATRSGRFTSPGESYVKELYARGRQAENSRNRTGIQTAKEAYRRAVEHDSAFALGYAGLAGVYGFMADYAYAPVRPALDTARMMALRAVQLDSTLPETRTALGITLGDAGDFAAAERELRRAIELDQGNGRAHYWYSVLLVALGRADEALSESRLAAKLDSFAPRGVAAMQRYALHLLAQQHPWSRRPDVEQPVLKLEPGEPWARARMAVELSGARRCDEARSQILQAQQLVSNDNFRMLPFVGMVHWKCGDEQRARAILTEMKRRPDVTDYGYRVAILHTLFGEKDSAFVWLKQQRWTMAQLSGLRADSWLDPLRSDPRFAELLHQLGLRDMASADGPASDR
jgi:Flp pilus assembly protein TadD